MKWRNQQIYHLRQDNSLTADDQDYYFFNVIQKLYNEDQPNQILFSLLENGVCIGYGGLVHINWTDKNAEISFIMNTELEETRFKAIWTVYLKLIEIVAFFELNFYKLYTYAFDLRPHLYDVLEDAGWAKEAVLKNHFYLKEEYKNIIIHSKFNANK
jgi:RimJ/RimL family protein N-acetyltransferase